MIRFQIDSEHFIVILQSFHPLFCQKLIFNLLIESVLIINIFRIIKQIYYNFKLKNLKFSQLKLLKVIVNFLIRIYIYIVIYIDWEHFSMTILQSFPSFVE